MSETTVAIIGAGGLMAPGVIADLNDCAGIDTIRLIDHPGVDLSGRAERITGCRTEVRCVDATQEADLCSALTGVDAVANAASYPLNLQVMRACLAVGAHYADLGGLFHTTRQQLGMDHDFRERHLGAVLGMGSAPGITNVLARVAAAKFDLIETVAIRDGTYDPTAGVGLQTGYALATVLDEASQPAVVWEDDEFRTVPPFTVDTVEDFGDPIGKLSCHMAIHSEIATLPSALRARRVTFSVGLPPPLVATLDALRATGMMSRDPVTVAGCAVAPVDVLLATAGRVGVTAAEQQPADLDHLRVVASGSRDGRHGAVTLDLRVGADPDRGLSATARGTGMPLGMVVGWLATGAMAVRGVVAPEALDDQAILRGLEQRGLRPIVSCTP